MMKTLVSLNQRFRLFLTGVVTERIGVDSSPYHTGSSLFFSGAAQCELQKQLTLCTSAIASSSL